MPRYLPPKGSGHVAITVCGRCNLKVYYDDLVEDRNVPGLWVCTDCCDEKDPYKLPARRTEDITLRHPRPDEELK